MTYGGSLIRPEATGFGAVYYGKEVLAHFNDTYEGKTIAVSGYGNVAWGVCIKAKEYGAKVVSISGRDGFVYDPDGINTDEKIDFFGDGDDQFGAKRFDAGLGVGVAYEINKFFIDLSGEFGLAKLADGDGAPKNMNFSIGVGYKF